MASLTREPNGTLKIQVLTPDGKRPSIRLGKIAEKRAQSIKLRVDEISASYKAGVPFDPDLQRWIDGLDDVLHEKISRHGLIPARIPPVVVTIKLFLDEFLVRRNDVKPATREIWRQTMRNVTDYFGDDQDITTIDEAKALDFKQYLSEQKLAPTTVSKRLQTIRGFFHDARRRKLIKENPFAEVSSRAVIRLDKRRFITPEETKKLLEACPNQTWRTIVGLTRYAGFRCPSEVLSLRWQDIDWDKRRMMVTSPKTECHGRGTRVVPLFPALRPILEEAFELATEGDIYVVDEKYRRGSTGPNGWRNCNLRSTFERIVSRAGLTPWPKLFHALRSSCESELAHKHPIHNVTAWLGNTPAIALKHYLLTTDADFDRANGLIEENTAKKKAVQIPVQQDTEPARSESQPTDENLAFSEENEMVRVGAEVENWDTRIRT